jgi:hypothetical protein
MAPVSRRRRAEVCMDASYGLVNSRPRREGYLVGGKAAGPAFTNQPAGNAG